MGRLKPFEETQLLMHEALCMYFLFVRRRNISELDRQWNLEVDGGRLGSSVERESPRSNIPKPRELEDGIRDLAKQDNRVSDKLSAWVNSSCLAELGMEPHICSPPVAHFVLGVAIT